MCLAENFDDVDVGDDPAAEPDATRSALRKARALHAATGLPALAETTCCHVAGEATKPPSETIYRIDGTVDDLLARMRPNSAPDREAVFTSAGAYVDDGIECIGEGVCIMPLAVAEARHATIATSTALDELFVKVRRSAHRTYTRALIRSAAAAEQQLWRSPRAFPGLLVRHTPRCGARLSGESGCSGQS